MDAGTKTLRRGAPLAVLLLAVTFALAGAAWAQGEGAADGGSDRAEENTFPRITAKKPTPSRCTSDRTPVVGAKVTDEETDLRAGDITLYLDDKAKDFSYDRDRDRVRFVPKAKLSLGMHRVRVRAEDAQGAVSGVRWRFFVGRPDGNPGDSCAPLAGG